MQTLKLFTCISLIIAGKSFWFWNSCLDSRKIIAKVKKSNLAVKKKKKSDVAACVKKQTCNITQLVTILGTVPEWANYMMQESSAHPASINDWSYKYIILAYQVICYTAKQAKLNMQKEWLVVQWNILVSFFFYCDEQIIPLQPWAFDVQASSWKLSSWLVRPVPWPLPAPSQTGSPQYGRGRTWRGWFGRVPCRCDDASGGHVGPWCAQSPGGPPQDPWE